MGRMLRVKSSCLDTLHLLGHVRPNVHTISQLYFRTESEMLIEIKIRLNKTAERSLDQIASFRLLANSSVIGQATRNHKPLILGRLAQMKF